MGLFKKVPRKAFQAAMQALAKAADAAEHAYWALEGPDKKALDRAARARRAGFLHELPALGNQVRDASEAAELAFSMPPPRTLTLRLKPAKGPSLVLSYEAYAQVMGEDPGLRSLRPGEQAVRTLAVTRNRLDGYKPPELYHVGPALGRTVIEPEA